MPKLNTGDKVKIIYHTRKSYIGKRGKVVFVGNSLKSSTMPTEGTYGSPDLECRYNIELEDGIVVDNLREVHLLKL